MKMYLIIGGVIIAVVVIIAMLATSGFFTSPYFEEKTQFGTFGQDIRVNYDDGTSDSLSILENKPLSVVTYNGRSITSFDYTLKVKANGTGYTDATVTLTNYKVVATISQGSTKECDYRYPLTSGANTIPFDNSFHAIGGTANFPVVNKMESLGLNSGIYTITFTATGTVTYNGNPGGASSTASMPAPINSNVMFVTDSNGGGGSGSVTIVLEQSRTGS